MLVSICQNIYAVTAASYRELDNIQYTQMPWWSRYPLWDAPLHADDVNRNDFPTFHGRMRLRIESFDPDDICSDVSSPNERVLVEFDQIHDELWNDAYQTFCNEGGFEEDDEDALNSNLHQVEDTKHARVIFDEFTPEGTMISIKNYYNFDEERGTTIDFSFWEPRNPQSLRRLRNALTIWRDCLEKATFDS